MATELFSKTLSVEESDHVERSVKKIKASIEGSNREDTHARAVRSFKDTLICGKKDVSTIVELDNIDKLAFDAEEDWVEDDFMHDETVDTSIPSVQIDKEVKNNLRRPWKFALIVKLLGKTLNFLTFQSRILKFWSLNGDVDMIDIGLAALGSTTVCIRLPKLPIEYFYEDILMDIGRKVGKPLKLDANTSLAIRGKFARICVEVDLSKPLISRIRVGNFIQVIEYEFMHTVCFECGVYGHRMGKCPQKILAPDMEKNDVSFNSFNVMNDVNKAPMDGYGHWILAQRKPWRGSSSKGR
ncbi:hypothetical protein REPUB_Repub10bG0085200 [Reevesia pubescens]